LLLERLNLVIQLLDLLDLSGKLLLILFFSLCDPDTGGGDGGLELSSGDLRRLKTLLLFLHVLLDVLHDREFLIERIQSGLHSFVLDISFADRELECLILLLENCQGLSDLGIGGGPVGLGWRAGSWPLLLG
jgi:hypothetical protein